MIKTPLITHGLTIAIVAIAGALPGMAGATDVSADGSAGQKIYLDPATGNVIDAPNPATRHGNAGAAQRKQTKKHSGPKAWKTPSGAQMLTPDPDAAPASGVVRCPDGSLRMGRAPAARGQSARQALCASAAR